MKNLNLEVNKLAKGIEDAKKLTNDEFFTHLEKEARPEFKRLLRESPDFERFGKASVITLLELNITYRFIPLHNFRPRKNGNQNDDRS